MKSINIPFSFSNGGVSESSDIAIITQNKIVDVLITNSAERAINTSYGVGIQSLLYESIDSLLFDDFKSEALVKINEVLDTGSVLDISIAQEDLIQTAFVEDSTIAITVVYSLPTTNSITTFTFNVSSDF
jgi:hypothetical protein